MRIYDKWAGNPKGTPEDPARCVVAVWAFGHAKQCQRKRGKGRDGLLCGTHANKEARGGRLYIPSERPAREGAE
jgi:hypothetical protein